MTSTSPSAMGSGVPPPPTRRSSTRWRWTRTTWPARARRGHLRRSAGPRADRGRARRPSGRWPRWRSARARTAGAAPYNQVTATSTSTRCWRGLRPRPAPPPRPPADHRRGLRGRHRPRRQGPRARREPHLHHGFRALQRVHYPGFRDLRPQLHDPRGEGRRDRRRADRGGRDPVGLHPRRARCSTSLWVWAADTVINPSGGPQSSNPIMATGLVRIAEAAGQIRDNGKHRTLASLDLGSVPAAEPGLHPGRRW